MTKSTITRERIARIANPDAWVKCTHEEVQELARMALAAMDSEPVAYIFKHPAGRLFWSLTDESNKGHDDVMPVYAAPQSPGSEPATVPGKWIPVSEQMPDDDDFVYIWPRPDFGVELHVGQYCERSHKGGGWYAQVYEQNYGIEWHPITVTHWMPLPAGPQEVR
ncbi:TPA: DUF551 domain-containing protein [Klebsiella pneumoniae]|nr:DUF551 domain-containing protein [Klebsiella pneumoniae]